MCSRAGISPPTRAARYASAPVSTPEIVLGYVGATGNADPSAPHLHFAVFALGPEARWWEGTALNPYPLLVPGRG